MGRPGFEDGPDQEFFNLLIFNSHVRFGNLGVGLIFIEVQINTGIGKPNILAVLAL